jgi:ribonuclease E
MAAGNGGPEAYGDEDDEIGDDESGTDETGDAETDGVEAGAAADESTQPGPDNGRRKRRSRGRRSGAAKETPVGETEVRETEAHEPETPESGGREATGDSDNADAPMSVPFPAQPEAEDHEAKTEPVAETYAPAPREADERPLAAMSDDDSRNQAPATDAPGATVETPAAESKPAGPPRRGWWRRLAE